MRRSDLVFFPLLCMMMLFTITLKQSGSGGGGAMENDEMVDEVAGKETNRRLPIIFVGGTPRSGASLVRSILDAHSMVRCGRDSVLMTVLLNRYKTMRTDPLEQKFMQMFKLDDQLMERSYAGLVYEFVVSHGDQAQRYCKKDNNLIEHAPVLMKLFPRSKFVLVIRDGRASVDSLMRRPPADGTQISKNNFTTNLAKWEEDFARQYEGCRTVGQERCFPLYYEQLVLKPKETLEALLFFLNLPWEDAMLDHSKLVGTKVDLSPREREVGQLSKALYPDSKGIWYSEQKFPNNKLRETLQVAPMLKKLGYGRFVVEGRTYGDINQNNYGCTQNICRNGEFWTDDTFES